MNRRIGSILLVVILAAGTLAVGGLASAGGRAPTRVTLTGPDGDFHGRITSTARACLGGRTVRLWMSDSGDPGTFARTGNMDTSERSGNFGVYSFGNTGLRDGFFFAQATRTEVCRAGRSPVKEYDNGNPV